MKLKTLILFFSFGFFLIAHNAFADSPFGGTVVATPQTNSPTATCAGGTSFTITPAGNYPTGPYYTTTGTGTGSPSAGGGVLGNYSQQNGPCCVPDDNGNCNPITTYVTTQVGFGGNGVGGAVSSFSSLSIPSGNTSGGAGYSPSTAGGESDTGRTSDTDSTGRIANPQTNTSTSPSQSVINLQTLLNENGATLVVDGKFGAKTKAAVRLFQKQNGLVADGIAGPKTLAALSGKTSYTTNNATW